jgi:hypothetical protein
MPWPASGVFSVMSQAGGGPIGSERCRSGQGRLVVIDFPQAVDASENVEAPDLLHRDLENVGTWFGRRGVPLDVEAVFVDLLADLML